MKKITATFPPKMQMALFDESKRYLIFYGGRGGGKSWSIARALLLRSLKRPIRVLCVRETMTSTEDSVYALLVDQIAALGIGEHFHIEKKTIYCNNGSTFRFAGIRSNPDALKSAEGVDICWAEEAQTMTETSWRKLIPTIRKAGSQIIVSFNPDLEEDETFQRFVADPPESSLVVKINYDDNPFLTKELLYEAEEMKKRDPEGFHNVWLGFPLASSVEAVYGRELRQMESDGRITSVPYDDAAPVHTFWDLGWRDTSIILAQMVGFEFHVIDFIEANNTSIPEYLMMLDRKPYVYGVDYLPHDAAAKEKGTGRSIVEILRNHGRTVHMVPRLTIGDGINAARMMFPRIWVDQSKCKALMSHMRHYVWDQNSTKREPLHDDNSHAADAWRYMAVSLTDAKPSNDIWRKTKAPTQAARKPRRPYSHIPGAWLA